jgi:hypothetical protein
MTTVDAAELARCVRKNAPSGVKINRTAAAYFLGFWLEAGIVEEVVPGRYRITPHGQDVAAGLLDVEPDTRAA